MFILSLFTNKSIPVFHFLTLILRFERRLTFVPAGAKIKFLSPAVIPFRESGKENIDTTVESPGSRHFWLRNGQIPERNAFLRHSTAWQDIRTHSLLRQIYHRLSSVRKSTFHNITTRRNHYDSSGTCEQDF